MVNHGCCGYHFGSTHLKIVQLVDVFLPSRSTRKRKPKVCRNDGCSRSGNACGGEFGHQIEIGNQILIDRSPAYIAIHPNPLFTRNARINGDAIQIPRSARRGVGRVTNGGCQCARSRQIRVTIFVGVCRSGKKGIRRPANGDGVGDRSCCIAQIAVFGSVRKITELIQPNAQPATCKARRIGGIAVLRIPQRSARSTRCGRHSGIGKNNHNPIRTR